MFIISNWIYYSILGGDLFTQFVPYNNLNHFYKKNRGRTFVARFGTYAIQKILGNKEERNVPT